jgi:hypothetical protein
MMGRVVVTSVLAGLAFSMAGCGSGQSTPLTVDEMELVLLRDVAELLREYQVSAKKPPRSLNDLRSLGDAGAPTGFSAIRSNLVIVRWEATLPDSEVEPNSPPSDLVLAYGKGVPENGGPVLMLDRRIRTMTADDFKAAQFAGVATSTTKAR